MPDDGARAACFPAPDLESPVKRVGDANLCTGENYPLWRNENQFVISKVRSVTNY